MIAGLLAALALAMCYPPPVAAPVSVPFVQPACSYCPGHRGLEYELAPGTSVRAVAPGVVTFVGLVVGTRYVVVLQPDGLRATYGMLQSVQVNRGDVVIGGQPVGVGGGPFYFGLRDAADSAVDPTPMLGVLVGRPRLVPAHGDRQRRAPSARLTCTAGVSGVVPA